jgi:S-DNA-T family DNA segregation ATPase FtsK/SpoIIIE
MSSNPEFLCKPDFKIRVISILGAFTCILGGILLFLSIGASLFLWTFINAGPGNLLSGAYGMFAFIIPVYLFWAAWILIDPVFRPGRIFLLSSTVILFLTLALGFSFIRDFETRRREFEFLGLLGQTGLSIAVITAVILECLGLLIVHSLFFGSHENSVPPQLEPPSAELVHSELAHEEQVHEKQVHSESVHSEQVHEELVHSEQVHEKQIHEEPVHSELVHSEQVHEEQIHEEQVHEELVHSEQIHEKQVHEELVHSEQVHEEQVHKEPAVIKKAADSEKPAILPDWKPPASPAVLRKLEEEKTRESAEEPLPTAGGTASSAEPIPEPWKVPDKDKILVLDASVFNPYAQASRISPKVPWLIQEALDEIEHLEPHFAGTKKEEDSETGTAALHASAGEPLSSGDPAGYTGEVLSVQDAAEYTDISADPEYPADTSEDNVQEDDLAAANFPFDAAYESSGMVSTTEPSGTTEDFPPAELKPLAVPGMVKKNHKKHKETYVVPVEGILNQYPDGQYWIVDEETNRAAQILQDTLSEFGIQAEVTGIRKGPVITMFEILPAPGVKLSKIVNLQDNITLRLAASSVRIVAPIPGKHAVGIEVPNKKRNIVSFREIIEGELNHKREHHKSEVPVVLGKGITGEAITVDLTQMPHLLIAGATGSGKSVCVNTMILSILYQLAPAKCRLILIDPKIVELKLYNDIPHLLTPVITEPKRAFQALQYCIYEMERRYACLDSMGVRDIKSYNRRIKERNIAAEHIPYIVVVIDEFADLMATTGKELESTVARLAAMSRAVGIHLVLATQRPSIDVITGLIKANIPSRIAFMVASKMDSRIIIDMVGAEKLLGKGDMLYAGAVDPFPIRMQGAFISEEEVERVVEYVKTLGEPEYIDDEIFYDEEEEDSNASLFSEGNDPLYEKALEVVFQQGKASASYIQRRLKIGYNRAARLVEEMEHRGIVGPAQGSKPRELLRIM